MAFGRIENDSIGTYETFIITDNRVRKCLNSNHWCWLDELTTIAVKNLRKFLTIILRGNLRILQIVAGSTCLILIYEAGFIQQLSYNQASNVRECPQTR